MARGGAKRNVTPKPAGASSVDVTPAPKRQEPQRPAPRPKTIEDQLFFARIRRRSKWVFVFLAVVFVASFVLFGVGSGSSGLGDLLNGSWIFGSGNKGSSTPGVKKAQKLVDTRPKDPASYRALATAYQAAGKPDDAISPLTKYTELRPKDSDALLELASLYGGKASRLTTEAQIRQSYPTLVGGSAFLPDSGTDIGKALASDQVVEAVQSRDSDKITKLYSEVSSTYGQQVGTYKKLVALDPQDSTLLVQLAQAQQQSGDNAGAIASYKKFLEISPDDPSANAVKQQLQALQPAATTTVPSTTAASKG